MLFSDSLAIYNLTNAYDFAPPPSSPPSISCYGRATKLDMATQNQTQVSFSFFFRRQLHLKRFIYKLVKQCYRTYIELSSILLPSSAHGSIRSETKKIKIKIKMTLFVCVCVLAFLCLASVLSAGISAPLSLYACILSNKCLYIYTYIYMSIPICAVYA